MSNCTKFHDGVTGNPRMRSGQGRPAGAAKQNVEFNFGFCSYRTTTRSYHPRPCAFAFLVINRTLDAGSLSEAQEETSGWSSSLYVCYQAHATSGHCSLGNSV